jgi:hypothetical protein
MQLDSRQTRRTFLTGTVSFPVPFPSAGAISFEARDLTYSEGKNTKAKDLVVVQESCHNSLTMARAVLQKHVAAIFVPGIRGPNNRFQISQQSKLDDLEKGEWFVDSDVNTDTIRSRLNWSSEDDITTRGSVLRGIVFTRKDAPVRSVAEVTETAEASVDIAWPTMFQAADPMTRSVAADRPIGPRAGCLCISCRCC